MGYKERIKHWVQQLKKAGFSPKVKYGRPVSKKTLQKALDFGGGVLPDVLLRFYREMNGVTLDWEEGQLDIPSMEVMFGGFDHKVQSWDDDTFKGRLWFEHFDEWLTAEELAILKSCRSLEPIEGASTDFLVHCVGDRATVYVVDRGIFSKVHLSLEDYFVVALESAGLWNWQAFFLEDSNPFMLEQLNDKLNVLFPDSILFKKDLSSHLYAKEIAAVDTDSRVVYTEHTIANCSDLRGTIVEKKKTKCLVQMDIGLLLKLPTRHLKKVDFDAYEEARHQPEAFFSH